MPLYFRKKCASCSHYTKKSPEGKDDYRMDKCKVLSGEKTRFVPFTGRTEKDCERFVALAGEVLVGNGDTLNEGNNWGDDLLDESIGTQLQKLLKHQKRAIVFIDGDNLDKLLHKMGIILDFNKLFDFFNDRFDLVRMIYYTALKSDNEYDNRHKLVDFLSYNRYKIVSKHTRVFHDPKTKKITYKGNLDVEIAVDMVTMVDSYDTAILISGDSDFVKAVDYVQRIGKKVIVAHSKQSGMLGDELLRISDDFVELAKLKGITSPRNSGASQ
jgi:uncharacterized LabA/DUF88 family protein